MLIYILFIYYLIILFTTIGVLRIYSLENVEMEIYHTSLGEMGPRNGPEENYSPMMTEKLGTIQLTDGKLASEIARIEKEKNSRIRKKGFLSEDDLLDPLLEVPHLDIIGAYLSIQLKPLTREQKRILLELKTKKPKRAGGSGGGGGLTFSVKDPSLSPNALLQALIIDILVIAKPVNQSTCWLMVGALELSEEKKSKKVSRKSDSGRKNESKQNHHHQHHNPSSSSSSSCYSELHNTLQISSIYTKRQIFLDRALKLGKIASHEFHQKILVVVTHGGVRVYDVMALIENRKRLLAKHLPVVPEHEPEEEEEEEDEDEDHSASDSSSTGKEKESGNIDDTAANVNGDQLKGQTTSHLNDIAAEDDEADLPVCLGSLGGVNFEDKITNSFGRINWEGSSISIGKTSNRNGANEYQIPDVYVSRAFPPCLIQIILNS